jgi:hypothetical protein
MTRRPGLVEVPITNDEREELNSICEDHAQGIDIGNRIERQMISITTRIEAERSQTASLRPTPRPEAV